MYCSLSAYGRLFRTLWTPNTCPCPLTRGVRLREVKNVVFERRNRRDRGLVSANGRCPLTPERCALVDVWLYNALFVVWRRSVLFWRSLFMNVSKPRPNDHPLLVLFVVGGVTCSEVHHIREALAAYHPNTQVRDYAQMSRLLDFFQCLPFSQD